MQVFKPSIQTILIFLALFSGLFLLPAHGFSDNAKEHYLKADDCYKNLKASESLKKKETEWLNCISKYENIQRLYPESSWAPAGMYKAAQLSLDLAKISGRATYQDQASSLLARLRNQYSQSAYSGPAKTLLKSINPSAPFATSSPASPPAAASPAAASPAAAAEEKETASHSSNDSLKPSPKVSKKEQTKNDALIQKSIQENGKSEGKELSQAEEKLEPKKNTLLNETDTKIPQTVKTTPAGDSVITDLRVWSNPEYTRIVVNVGHEREYSHNLLNKDPDINKPFQRLYVDVEQTRLGKNLAEHTPINDNLLIQARAGQFLPHTVRLVVDIKSFENYKVFSLKDPFRIVIDVWGKGSNGSPPIPDPPALADSKKPEPEKQTSKGGVTTDNLQSSNITRQFALGVRKIIIDPGHGGSDPGAPGFHKDVWEKDLVLKMAQKLSVILRERLKCTVLLTRNEDKRLTLEERTAIANTKRADLFISLHCNAAKNKDLKGIETYFLNLATDSQAIAVAARENATSEKNISDLDYILSDLMKNAKIEESTRLANIVHKNLIKGMKAKYSDINDLGVKQAPFYVLLGARMPSILVETSFISNKTEGKRLMEESYQKAVCESIADGIEKYIDTTNPKHL
ncbi:MAG: N-acetylmuramoyl-L-alanine amidase [Desulfobacterales bacterium RIFOXYA12_FULL_46_15]|nr:MAG: N-acetylmuramoyl-L-alanine amidase [Desulfobacterales bacterium RIFOXYA12_FULL_46_15]